MNATVSRSFNGPAILVARHQSTSLSENAYEKIVTETLESLSDYFDELLENQTKIANYDLSLSVSFRVALLKHRCSEDESSLICGARSEVD